MPHLFSIDDMHQGIQSVMVCPASPSRKYYSVNVWTEHLFVLLDP